MLRLCSTCGQPIGESRLEALPSAEECIRCANGRKLEAHWARRDYPIAALRKPEEVPVADAVVSAQERAEHTVYRIIEGLEEIEG